MRIIIAGGTGLIGSKLSASLAKDGHDVVILSRNPGKYSLPKGVRAEKWDSQTAKDWGHLADGADAIINLAGENISGGGFIPARWTPERKKRIEQSRINAGQAIVAAVQAAVEKPEVVIQASGVDFYPDSGNLVDETASPSNSFLGTVVTQCWEPSTVAVESMGVRRVVARLGLVLSMEGGALPITALPYRLFAGGPLGSGNQWWSWVHIDDVVSAIKFMIENKNASGPINVTAPNPLTNKGFGKVIGKVLKRPSFFPVPAFMLKLVLGEISAIVLEGRNVSSQKLLDLGFSFKYNEAEAALRDLLA